MLVLGTQGAFTVGIWRGLIYDLSAEGWIVAALAALLGIALTVFAARAKQSQKVVVGIVLAAVFFLEIFRRRLGLDAETTVPLILLGAGSFLVTTVRVTHELVTRKRRVQRLLQDALGNPSVAGQLDAYFAASGRLHGRLDPVKKELRRAFRKLSRRPGPSWQRAASALTAFAQALADYTEARASLPRLEGLDGLDREGRDAAEALRRESLNAARSFEAGERPDPEAWNAANRRALEVGREWQYAVGVLAARHRVSVPRWFLKVNCELAKAG
jgi:hypothetical protein